MQHEQAAPVHSFVLPPEPVVDVKAGEEQYHEQYTHHYAADRKL